MTPNEPALAAALPWWRERWGFVLGLTALPAALWCACVFLRAELLFLLGLVSDDGFYYLQIARHLAAEHWSTFDGINPTNGYHPGWMAILSLTAFFVHDRVLLLRCALGEAFLLHLLTAWLLYRILLPITGRNWAALAAGCWLLNPLPWTMALQVVESSLYVLATVNVIRVFAQRIVPHLTESNDIERRQGDFVMFGLALGGLCWSRTEGVVFSGTTLLFLLLAMWRQRPALTAWVRPLIASGVTCGFVILPWFIYSYLTVGSFAQDSARMKLLWKAGLHESLLQRCSELPGFILNKWIVATVQNLLLAPWVPDIAIWIVVAGLGLTLVPTIMRYGDARLRLITLWLFCCTLVTGISAGSMLSDVQRWYLAQPGLVVYLVGCGWLAWVLHSLPVVVRRIAAPISAIALWGISLALNYSTWTNPPELQPWQRDVYHSQQEFESQLPQQARIGCINAGIPAYFSDRTIINLDGLVNHTAVGYWYAHRFADLLRDEHIDYVIDEKVSLQRAQAFSSRPLPLEPLGSFPLTRNTSERWVFAVTR